MTHSIRPDIPNLHGDLSAERKPILTVDSGDTVLAATRCSGWGAGPPVTPFVLPRVIPRSERADPEHDEGLCLVGPIAVRDAAPGTVLEVAIEELVLGDYGVTVTGGRPSEWQKSLGLNEDVAWMMWRFDDDRRTATNQHGHTVGTAPFLGFLGTAPAEPGYHDNLAPRYTGGNMDCRDLVAGSTLYLPVAVDGALLSFGDGHAAQGDGEACGAAIESPMRRVRLRLTARNDMKLRWPAALTPSGWVTLGFHEDLRQAASIAMSGMLDLMEARLGCTRKDAVMLASMCVDLRITQAVNPTPGVHAVWRDRLPDGGSLGTVYASHEAP